MIFANFAKSAKKHKITNFAKFVILAYPLSVIGFQIFKSLLLFKYEVKQNVSNTNVVRNNIWISFAMVSMAGATIWILQISRNLQKARNHKFREICEKGTEAPITRLTNFAKFVGLKKLTYYLDSYKFCEICHFSLSTQCYW